MQSVQTIARWCMCKLFLRNSLCVQTCNPTGSMEQGTGSLRGLQCWGRTCSGDSLGHPFFCNLSYSQIGFHPVPQRNGGELPQSCKRDRKNVITHNSCILVRVPSHGFYVRTMYVRACFLPHKTPSSCWARVQLWQQGIRWHCYRRFEPTLKEVPSLKTIIISLHFFMPGLQCDWTGFLLEGLDLGCTHTLVNLAKSTCWQSTCMYNFLTWAPQKPTGWRNYILYWQEYR